ncbi:AraC family transcriptional regulator [Flavobacterium sp. Root935]|jgi:AraC family transcriptional activator of pobA|uniref:helix-turn-helix domain-containing protein n=1 Tax=Flavobacterium sp. Root935 TaxID=1736610 RepID=UPI00070D3C70|nr:AraC family transcriptional regulator [Flavobacterium sp. Root935]KRD57878.1 AraC family transcriptional regulator [Flavobacterium sp. Root935]
MKKSVPHKIKSISELHQLFALPKPDHPLVSVIDFALLSYKHSDIWKHFTNDFYCITLKKGINGKFKYGQRDYDFDEGMMTLTKPDQVFSVTHTNDNPVTGFMLVFKPDLIRNYPLGKTIHNYGFFSYSIAEALHLSDKEDVIISGLLKQMQDELKNNIDHYSQDLIVSHLDLLLNYINRFYGRQFITRKTSNPDLLSRIDQTLLNYFENENGVLKGVPTVQYLSQELNISSNYLSDLLRSITGLNTQQYIQNHIIEKSKQLLAGSNLSVNEIAYSLGFEYPQSFSKLFKKKTNITPLQFRQSFN